MFSDHELYRRVGALWGKINNAHLNPHLKYDSWSTFYKTITKAVENGYQLSAEDRATYILMMLHGDRP